MAVKKRKKFKGLKIGISVPNKIRLAFKEVYCQDCSVILARFNLKYFTDSKVAELTRLHYHTHIKRGHALVTITSEDSC